MLAFLLTFALMVTGGALAGATVSYAEGLHGRLLPATTIAGVDVGALTQDEALTAVETAIAAELDRTISVSWRDREWSTTPRQLGSRSNAEAVIAEVAQLQSGMRWQDWAELRWFGAQTGMSQEVAITHDRSTVRAFVKSMARQIDRDPRGAELAAPGDGITITPASTGYQLRRRPAVRRLMRSLRNDRTQVALSVRRSQPEITEDAFSQVLLLDQGDHRLTLYLDGEKARSWLVAVGTGNYPTPLGRFEVTLKRYMPTWVNPSPDGWGSDMPASIAPGPGNPLGVRALNWDASAIRFHGTQAVNTLGTDASHGCVRMSNTDVTELYDLVDVGAVIVSQV